MEKKMNTITELEMADGTKVNLTLNYWALYQLKPKGNKIYDEYNEIMRRGTKEELDMTVILYTAYLCANLDKECVSYEAFLQNLPTSRTVVRSTVRSLTEPKKQ